MSPDQFRQQALDFMLTPAFISGSENEQQDLLIDLRDTYKGEDPKNAYQYDVSAETLNKRFRMARGQGRHIPTDLSAIEGAAPWQQEGWDELDEDNRILKLEEFNDRIPEYASKLDSINRNDNEFFLRQLSREQARRVQGENTGAIEDTGWRIFEGFAAGLASYAGQQELADEIRDWTEENPVYDQRFTSKLYQGLGDLGASTTIFLGATALSGGNVGVGTAALLAGNGVMRYQDAYKQAIDRGLDPESAHDAGIYALPGAAVDTLGDRLIAGKFLPTKLTSVLKTGTEAAKRQAIAQIFKDATFRGLAMHTARDAFAEGITESLGDFTSGYGAFIATGDEEFIPTFNESKDAFLVGAVLGGGVGGITGARQNVQSRRLATAVQDELDSQTDLESDNAPSEQETAAKVRELIDENRHAEAAAMAKGTTVKGMKGDIFSEALGPTSTAELAESEVVPVLLPTSEATTEELDEYESSPETTGKKKAIEKALYEEFQTGVEGQLALYDPNTLPEAFAERPRATTAAPLNIRQGTLESGNPLLAHFETPVRSLIQKITNDYSNIDLVDPADPNINRRADFNTLSRSRAEGDVTVAGSPNLATKIEEELATGNKDLFLVAPVDSKQDSEIGDKIPRATADIFTRTPYEESQEEEIGIDNDSSMAALIDELNTKYGRGKWVVKDSSGAAGQGIYFGEAPLRHAYESNGNYLAVNGFYAEPYNENIARKKGEFRVHVVKRGGQMEVVPYATHSKSNPLPFVLRSQQVQAIEDAALAKANTAIDSVEDNAIFGVDVVRGMNDQYEATELNPSQVEGTRSDEIGTYGESGYISTPYVNAALYSHLKGRVPAFVLIARPMLRNKAAMEFQVQGVGEQLTRMYQNARDKADLQMELLKTYGERFSDRVSEIWDALRDGLGQITDRLRDIIRSILTFTPQQQPAEVSEVNQPALAATTVAMQAATAQAQAATQARRDSSLKDPKALNEGFRYNVPAATVDGIENKSLFPEEVEAVVRDLTGGSNNVKVINDANAPWAGRITNRRDIQLNAARITSVEQARDILLEESIHAVWNDSEIQDSWAAIKSLATNQEIDDIREHYAEHGVTLSRAQALEEWANQEVRRQYLQQEGEVKNFVDRVWAKIKEIFGFAAPENASDAARIMHRALEYLSEETFKTSRMKPSAPAGSYVFRNGQVAGPGEFYILATHSTPNQFTGTERNPLGEFNHRMMSSGEGSQVYGWGTYLATSQGATDFYRTMFEQRNAPILPGFKEYIDEPLMVNVEDKLFKLWSENSPADFVANMVIARRISRSSFGDTSAPSNMEELDWLQREVDQINSYLEGDQIMLDLGPEVLAQVDEKIKVYSAGDATTFQVRVNAKPEAFLYWDRSFESHPSVIQRKLEMAYPNFFINPLFSPQARGFGEMLYNYLERITGSPQNASMELERLGFPGISVLDGGSWESGEGTHNYIVFNEARMEILGVEQTGATFAINSRPDLTLKADQELYNIPQKRKRSDQQKRLNQLKRLKIDDRFDGNTRALVTLLRGIKPKELEFLDKKHIDDFYDLVDHIYQARSRRVQNPDIRDDSQQLIDELQKYKYLLDTAFIHNTVKDLGGLIDFSKFPDYVMADRAEFEKAVNQAARDNDLDVSKENPANAKRFEAKQKAWRKKYEQARSEFTERYPSADAWISDIEEISGTPFKSQTFRDFLRLHHSYMTEIVDPNNLEGKTLYHHFHELNNMVDGQVIYPMETSIPWIRAGRDAKINVDFLRGKFRDPIIQRNAFLEGLDKAQKFTELKQTQLDRFSAFTEGKDFLQNDLMGPLLDTILRESANNQADTLRRYTAAKKQFEKNVKRKFSGEDSVVMSLVSRLIQFQAGRNPDSEFMRNLANERKAIANVIGDGTTDGRGSEATKREMRDTIVPILDRLVEGLEDSDQPMQDFMASMNIRMGLGNAVLGNQRALLLSEMQNLMGEYALDMEFVSEAFYKKPFKRFMNYLPRRAIPVNPERTNTRENSLIQEIQNFDDKQWQSNSVTAETEQLKDRSQIGENARYSNNIEYIFDRGIRIASLTGSTTAERFILHDRLKRGNPVAQLIEGSNSTYRTDQLREWSVGLFLNAMHSGSPLGSIGVAMKKLNEMYARVALSGLHQGLTQSVSGFTDYHVRTGNIMGAMEAAQYLITNRARMDAWFEQNAARIAERSLLGEQELDRRRAPSLSEGKIANHPLVKRLEEYYDGATKVITFSLRQGDDFTAKTLVVAEYARLLKEKGYRLNTLNDVDWNTLEGNILTQAMLNVERNINSSDKITRGELFTDRTWGLSLIRNISLAFSSHTMTLAAQFNLAVRDLIDLKNQGAGRDQMHNQVRTIGAILGQTFTFSTSRFAINAMLATAMIGMLRSLFDDEEGKLTELEEKLLAARRSGDDLRVQHAENELSTAKAVKKAINAFDSRNRSFQSYFQGVLKEELGSIHFVFGGPGLPQKLVFPVADNFGEKMHKEAIKEESRRIQMKIDDAKKRKKFGEVARLNEQKFLIESAEYLPLNIEQFGNIGLGGITGTALSATYATAKEFNDAAFGLTEINWNDFVLAAQSAGMGQADINKFLKTVDKIEDDLFKRQAKNEEQLEAAKLREQEQKERARKRRLQALMRELDSPK
jgi:hypothetical protein